MCDVDYQIIIEFLISYISAEMYQQIINLKLPRSHTLSTKSYNKLGDYLVE